MADKEEINDNSGRTNSRKSVKSNAMSTRDVSGRISVRSGGAGPPTVDKQRVDSARSDRTYIVDARNGSGKAGKSNVLTTREGSGKSGKSNGLPTREGSGRLSPRSLAGNGRGTANGEAKTDDSQVANTGTENDKREGSDKTGKNNAQAEPTEAEKSTTGNEERTLSRQEEEEGSGSRTQNTSNGNANREGSGKSTKGKPRSERNGSGKNNKDVVGEGSGRAGTSYGDKTYEIEPEQQAAGTGFAESEKPGGASGSAGHEEVNRSNTSNGTDGQNGTKQGAGDDKRDINGRPGSERKVNAREHSAKSNKTPGVVPSGSGTIDGDTDGQKSGHTDKNNEGLIQDGSDKKKSDYKNNSKGSYGNLESDTKRMKDQKTEGKGNEAKREKSGKADSQNDKKEQEEGRPTSADIALEELTRMDSFIEEGDIEKVNFFRVCKCLVEQIPLILADILAIYIPPKKLRPAIQKKKTLQLSHNQKHVIDDGKVPNYSKFDITLFHVLFQNLCPKCPKPTHDWGVYPKASVETTVGDDIERIRKLKNNAYGHLDSCLIPATKFKRMWDEFAELVSRLETLVKRAKYKETLDRSRSVRIDPLVDEEHVRTLKEWRDMDTQLDIKTGGTLKQLEPEFRKTKKSVDKMKRNRCSQPGILSRCRHDSNSIKFRMDSMAKSFLDTRRKVRQSKYIQKIRETTNINVQKLDGMRAYTKALISDFEEHGRPYLIENQNSITAKRVFADNGFIFLLGLPGDGKTSIGMDLLSQPYPDAVEPPIQLILTSPKQFTETIDPTRTYTLLIDDIFGKFCKDQSLIDGWTGLLQVMMPLFHKKRIRIIMTSRNYMYKDCAMLPAIRKHIRSRLVMNLMERENKQAAMERRDIFELHTKVQKAYVPEEHRSIILKSTPANFGFPICTRLLLTSRLKQSFKTPRQYLIEDLDNLFMTNHTKYVALAMVFLVYTDIVYENLDSQRLLSAQLNRLFKAKDLTPKAIESGLKSMENIYVFYSKAHKCYQFIHDVLQEAMFQSLSKHYPRKLIASSSLTYLNYFSITKSSQHQYDMTLNTEKDTAVHFPVVHQVALKERIAQELATKQPENFMKVAGIKTWQLDEASNFQDVFLSRDFAGVPLLVYAAMTSNVDLTQAILEAIPIRSDEMAADIYNAIIESCRRGNQRCFFCLLNEWKGQMNNEMALEAAEGGDVGILKHIVQHVDVNARNKDGDTLLMIAAEKGHLACVKLLTGINVSLVKETGHKKGGVLHSAVQGQNDDVINWLIKKVADDLSVEETDELFAKRDSNGRTVLHTAICEQNIGIARVLLEVFDFSYLSLTDNNGENVWHLANYHAKEELVKYMLNHVSEIVSSNDENGGTALHHAAAGGSVRIFNELLQAGLSPYGSTNDGNTVLHKAALHCKLEAVKYILQSIPDIIKKKNSSKWTVLHSAAAGGSVGVFNELVKAKLDPFDRTNDGCTVVHIAALNIHEELIRFLISNKTELLNLTNDDGETALHSAAVGGDINVFDLLINAGLSPTARTNEGRTVLQMAAFFGRTKLVKHIIKSQSDTLMMRDNAMRIALHYAAVDGNINMFTDLLNAGLQPRAVTTDGVSILHIAAYHGNISLIRYLKRNQSEIFPLTDDQDRSALHAAAAGGNITVFMEMSRAELSPTSVTKSGATVLHIAAYMGKLELLIEIIDKFSHIIPLIDNQGNTALHFAAAGGHINVLKELTKAGLSPTSVTNDGSTILHLAVGDGRVEMVSHIINNITEIIPTVNKYGETVMHYAAAAGAVYVFHKLTQADLSPEGKTRDGLSVLHVASFSGKLELVRHIINNVPNIISLSDDSHWTALHSASAGGSVDTFAELVRSGFSPKAVTSDESTVLHLAAFNGNAELCMYIKSNIPNIVQALDGEGWNALHAAASSGSLDTYKELVQAGLSPTITTKGGSSVLHLAAYYGHADLVKYIMKTTQKLVPLIDKAGRTALHDGAASGNMDVYNELINAGLSPTDSPHDGTTVLHIAAENCHSDLARHIIIKTPDIVLYMDHTGKTALHAAAAGGTWALFKKVCQFGISPKCTTDNGSTVLHIAAEHGNVPLVKTLVQGISELVHIVDDEGRTAMHFAAAGGNADVFDLLLKAGLKPEPAPNSSNSVLHVAAYRAHIDLVRYVIRNLPEMVPLTDESGWTALHYAAAAGNMQVFFILLKAGLSPRHVTHDGSTVLHKAAFCGNLELVEFILEVVPAIIQKSDSSNWTAIHSASAGGSVNIFTTLIGIGLSPRKVSSGGSTVLHIAAYNGRFNLVEFIIDHIQEIIHLIDDSGKSGLHYAAAGGNVKVFNELVHAGLSPQATTKDGSTALHIAAANRRVELVQYIIDNNPILIPQEDSSGWNAIHAAAAVGCIEVISLLIESGMSPGTPTKIGRTILHVAAYKSQILLVRHIVKKYKDIIHSTDNTGNTAMHSAAAGGNVGVFIELLHAGISPNATTDDGSTILHVAANNGKTDIARYIIQYIKEIVPETNDMGRSALHCAAAGRNTSVFDDLIRAGLSPGSRTKAGKTVLHETAFGGKPEFIRQIAKRFSKIVQKTDESGRTALHYVAAGGNVEAFNYLVMAGLSADDTTKDGSSVLHIASFNGNLELVIHIVDNIVEIIPMIDNSGKTALHHAAAGGNVEVFVELLQAGLSPKTTTNDGSTVLHIASYNGKLDLVQYIIRATSGVLPLADESGRTALHYAAAGGNVDVFVELVEAGLSPSAKTSSGSTVLHLAAATAQLNLVEHILTTNQNFIYSTDSQGRTALHVAAGKNGSSEVFDSLVKEGLSPMLKDKHGNTPLDLANTLIHQHVKKNHADFHASYQRIKTPRPEDSTEEQDKTTSGKEKAKNQKSKACVIQ
ncbi:uncharacterized protein [Argopecten irradians]|uniref:uncharacterized protein isoform X2 n=1 Tax=Argopecten irradians TaxID=31199 RepID=UPI0037156EFD